MENQFRNDDERAQYHHDDDARYKLDFRSTYLLLNIPSMRERDPHRCIKDWMVY